MLALCLIVSISAPLILAFFMAEEARGQPERLEQNTGIISAGRRGDGMQTLHTPGMAHLRWVRKLPLTWPEPSQPGVGHVMPSVLPDFQANWVPFT